jgi:D-3-phosphoglycerate dehydrogenase / 2-oxoglutarate reductase
MQKKRVLITDSVHPLLQIGLEQAGYVCDYYPKISLEDVKAVIVDYSGIIINSKIIVDRGFLDLAKKLTFIGRLGSGLEIIDLEYAKVKGVQVFRAPDGNCDAVAEHAMAFLLSLAARLKRGAKQVEMMQWNREAARGWELMGKTVAIIGFGYTGRAFAKRLQGFGTKILAYDKYLPEGYANNIAYVEEATMQEIIEQADVLSIHLPATLETKGFVNTAFLESFKKNLVLLNTSRGNIIPTLDLIQALEKGKVYAAGLDVFENEKTGTYSSEEKTMYQMLTNFEDVLLTPHVAGWTVASKERLASLLLGRILNL